MNVNVYLPDELGKRAKEAGLQFSQLLRAAVRNELERRKAMSQTVQWIPYDTVIDLEDDNRYRYQGKITGRQIAFDGNQQVFQTDDERVLVYDCASLKYRQVEDPVTDLRFLERGAYIEVMNAIGESAIVEL